MNCYKGVLFEQHGQNVDKKKTVIIYTDLQMLESFQLWDGVELDEVTGVDSEKEYLYFL